MTKRTPRADGAESLNACDPAFHEALSACIIETPLEFAVCDNGAIPAAVGWPGGSRSSSSRISSTAACRRDAAGTGGPAPSNSSPIGGAIVAAGSAVDVLAGDVLAEDALARTIPPVWIERAAGALFVALGVALLAGRRG